MKTFEHIFIVLSVLVACVACNGNTSTGDDTTPVSFSILPPAVQMKVGDTQLLMLSINKSAVWTSSDDEIAKVVEGVVEAKAIGHCVITAAIGTSTATADIYVTGSNGSTFTLNIYALEMDKGEERQVICRDTYGYPLTWKSDNEQVATVSQDGLVTAVGPGVTEIWVTNGVEQESLTACVRHKWGEYKMVWSDEFDGIELDRNVWNVEVVDHPANNEKQAYRDRRENLRVENGNLIIQLTHESNGGQQYTSGRINSKGKKEFLYGRMEARIKFPKGGGTWPAFWMMGGQGGWPFCGECDIIEHMGNQPNFSSFAVHTQEKSGNNGKQWHSGWTAPYSMEDDYHVYGVEWVKEATFGCDQIHFTVDGTIYATTTESASHRDDPIYWPFNKSMYFILNLAHGGLMGGNVDDNIFNNGNQVQMLVDWVRVYQRDEIE